MNTNLAVRNIMYTTHSGGELTCWITVGVVKIKNVYTPRSVEDRIIQHVGTVPIHTHSIIILDKHAFNTIYHTEPLLIVDALVAHVCVC